MLTTETLWTALRRRQGNGLVPLRKDWIAVTRERLAKALQDVGAPQRKTTTRHSRTSGNRQRKTTGTSSCTATKTPN